MEEVGVLAGVFVQNARTDAALIAAATAGGVALLNQAVQLALLNRRLAKEREALDTSLRAAKDNLAVDISTRLETQILQQWEDRELLERRIAADAELQASKLEAEHQLLHRRIEVEHEADERKKLRELTGRYRGRMVEAAYEFHIRMTNLYSSDGYAWLTAPRGYHERHYFFHTTVLRFLALLSIANRFERDAFYIESQLASRDEVSFLWYCKGMRVLATDVRLFAGLGYDANEAVDHLFKDELRDMCAAITKDDGSEVGLAAFVELFPNGDLERALQFFDGLKPNENRYRFDRVVALHLLVASFLNRFGYERQHISSSSLTDIAGQIRHEQVSNALIDLLDDVGLHHEAGDIRVALGRAGGMTASM